MRPLPFLPPHGRPPPFHVWNCMELFHPISTLFLITCPFLPEVLAFHLQEAGERTGRGRESSN